MTEKSITAFDVNDSIQELDRDINEAEAHETIGGMFLNMFNVFKDYEYGPAHPKSSSEFDVFESEIQFFVVFAVFLGLLFVYNRQK
ncbi:unnamed protein product [Caenorhabditis angaria]|uniref:Uncharacterized protein n=1 Tax=Caenorhabditis angaria TaxID=860376 RepID=A0A9P1INA2_9PELO|nr:unnamed protein product [Caenorhabditis angaria]